MSNNLFVDIHALQSVPPACLNRDDTGSPKSGTYGGTRRVRVSSQAWKRAARMRAAELLDTSALGIRSTSHATNIAHRITEKRPEFADNAVTMAVEVLKAIGLKLKTNKNGDPEDQRTGYLMFLAPAQIEALVDIAIAAADEAEGGAIKVDKKAAKAAVGSGNSLDIALFGRMVADAHDLGVEASCQVAHAIGVSASESTYDFYTAVDDLRSEEESGAGMMGTIELASAVLYRYATVSVNQLKANLGDDMAVETALAGFIDAFVTSLPTGRQNSTAAQTLPDLVLVTIRRDRPLSLVGAFEEPVRRTNGIMSEAITKLAEQAGAFYTAYDAAPEASFFLCTKSGINLEGLGENAQQLSLQGILEATSEYLRTTEGA